MKEHKIDICALSETKRKGQGTSKYGEYILVHSGKAKQERAQAGVGLLLHEKYQNNIEDIKYVNERILKTTLKINNTVTHLLSIYAPDISKPKEESEHFYELLQDTLDQTGGTDEVIILGDFNARIGNETLLNVKQKYNESIINENGELLIDFCARNELRINNTYFPHKSQHKYTFGNSRGQQSMIDYILSNRSIKPQQVLDVRTLNSANVGTDHSMVLCKILLESPRKTKSTKVTVEKYNIESLTDESTRHLYQNRLSSKLREIDIAELNVEDSWETIKTCILNAAEEAIGKRMVNINARNNRKPWFCAEVKELSQQKKKSYLAYKSTQTQEMHAEYVATRNRANSRIRSIKKEHWSKFTSDMDHDIYGAQRRVWKMLKNRKKPVNEFIQTKGIDILTWENYFQQLYSGPETPNIGNYKTPHQSRISKEDIQEGIKKLKNRKAPGTDNISNELLKYAGPELVTKMTTLYGKILDTSEIPSDWHESVTIPIFKKGQKTLPENYRGITLLNSSMKLFTHILKRKLEAQIQNREEQQGFRRNRSTTDALFIIKQLKEKAIEYNVPAYLCFVDLTKAFDKVRLTDVINLLKEKESPDNLVKVIHCLNTGNYTKIKAGDNYTKNIRTPGGIRQGDSLSPFLFNLIMDKIIEEVAAMGLGYRMGRNKISIICYADDAVIIAETENDLQRQLHKLYLAAAKLNMNISVEKSKCMTLTREPRRCKLVVQDQAIEQVAKFKYVGMDISDHHNPVNDLRSQINKATAIAGCLRQVVWANKYMRIDSKVKIYKTCVRPIMTYGIEVREETTKTKSMLRVAEMKILRSILGKTRRDRVRNDVIRDKCQVKDVVRWGRQRKREWHEHVERMTEDRLPRIAFQSRPAGDRPPGRPPKRWKDSWQSTSQESPRQPN